jgi:hypothetical protein
MGREIPILMSGPLVRATLAGQKTQTRRPIKRENKPDPGFEWAECLCREIDPSDTPCATCASRFPGLAAAGDRLWVRETWQHFQNVGQRAADFPEYQRFPANCFYRADESNPRTKPLSGKWRPSLLMPRWACRLVLPLVSVRVERVQAISEADAWAEGYGEHWQRRVKEAGADGPLGRPDARGWFAKVWSELYGTWAQNPWVVVYEWGEIEVSR